MTKSPADHGTVLTADDHLAREPSLFELALAPLRGSRRWLVLAAIPVSVGFMAVGTLSLWRFVNAESVNSLMQWALAFLFCMGAVSMMKIWYWMEMQAVSMTRHVNRLELQVSRLVQHLDSDC